MLCKGETKEDIRHNAVLTNMWWVLGWDGRSHTGFLAPAIYNAGYAQAKYDWTSAWQCEIVAPRSPPGKAQMGSDCKRLEGQSLA